MRVAIYFGEKNSHEASDIMNQCCGSIQFVCYTGLEKVAFDVFDGRKYDVLLMELESDKKKMQIDMVEEINRLNSNVRVVFVVDSYGKDEEALFLRKINIAGIIKRPLSIHKVDDLLNKIDADLRNKDKFIIKQNGNAFVEDYKDIMYFECSGHNVNIHCVDSLYTIYSSIGKVADMLPDSFYRCHKSFVVNMRFIKRIERRELELVNGYIIYVNKTRIKPLKEKFSQYIDNMAN